MTVRTILQEALAVVARDHTAVQLSVDQQGNKVRNPRSPLAVAWSSVGALVKVAPRYPNVVAEDKSPGNTDEAWRAYEVLERVAVLQGFAHTVEVDEAGQQYALAMFRKALTLVDDPPRRARKPAGATGAGAERGRGVINRQETGWFYAYCACGVCGPPRKHHQAAVADSRAHASVCSSKGNLR